MTSRQVTMYFTFANFIHSTIFNGHHAPTGFITAAIMGAALLVSIPAAAQDAHGVIAFGETEQGDGVAYGFSWNYSAKDTAHAEAIRACMSSGGTNCIELAWFQNGCGALAIDKHGNAQGKPGMTREQAETRALRTCEAAGGTGCTIVGSLCAAGGGEASTWSGSESVLPVQGPQETATGPEDESLTREERIRIQRTLNALGFDAGAADGVFGWRTRSAVAEWQNENGIEETGYVTRELAESLMAVGESSREERELPRKAIENRSGSQEIASRQRVPNCNEMEVGSFCWKEISNKPGCFLMTYDFHHTVNWSGECLDDVAHGNGTLQWRGLKVKPRDEYESSMYWPFMSLNQTYHVDGKGEIVQGKMEGRWLQYFSYQHVYEGNEAVSESEYVGGKLNGWFILIYYEDGEGEGASLIGNFVDNESVNTALEDAPEWIANAWSYLYERHHIDDTWRRGPRR